MSRTPEPASSAQQKAQFVKNLFNDLKADGVESSFELEGFLQAQYSKRDNLLQKKREAEDRIEELSVLRRQEIQETLDNLQTSFNSLKTQINNFKKEKLPNKFEEPQFYENVETIDTLSRGSGYLTVLNFVKATSDQIEANLENELETEAIELFHRLKSVKQLYMEDTSCNYLKEYCEKITAYWEARLQEKVVADFEKLLEAFGWPTSIKTANPTLETHEKFHKTIRNLFRISSSVKQKDASAPLVESAVFDDADPLLPIGVMMKPLKKRYKFHFFNNKVTGDPSKPEWYFCQIKKWMRELTPFVRSHLESFSVAEMKVSSAVEFVRSLSEMLLVKIDSQLSSEEGVDDEIFAKILEESITFESEAKSFISEDMDNCPTYFPKIVSTIYSQPDLLQRWLSIEKRACLEKLDEMFASPTAWNRASVPGPSEITDLFIAVLRFVTERFSYLEQPGHQLQFILLIVELLDDFRVRCLQTWQSKCEYAFDKPSSVLFDYIIADSINRVQTTLQTWQELQFFSSLGFFLEKLQEEEKKLSEVMKTEMDTQSNYMIELNRRASVDNRRGDFDLIGNASDGLFTSSIKLYKCLIDEIQSKWLQRVMEMIEEPLREYAKVKWQAFEIESIHSNNTPEFDVSINRVTGIVSSLKYAVMEGMDEKLGLGWIKKVAAELDKRMLRVIILPNRFSKDAVQKLKVDLLDGIIKFFSLLNVTPQIFFLAILSAMRILTMSTGDVMLLYEILTEGDMPAQDSALSELRIELRREIAIQIIKARTDFVL